MIKVSTEGKNPEPVKIDGTISQLALDWAVLFARVETDENVRIAMILGIEEFRATKERLKKEGTEERRDQA